MRNGKRTARVAVNAGAALAVTVLGMWLVWNQATDREAVGAVLAFALALRLMLDALAAWLNGPER